MIKVRVYGVRGIIPTPEPKNTKYGGNTSCVGVRIQGVEDFFIFDAGTGIKKLGEELSLLRHPMRIHLFLSHLHHDHIMGLPYFIPLYMPKVVTKIYAPRDESYKLQDVIETITRESFQSAPFGEKSPLVEYHELEEKPLSLKNVKIIPCRLNHPVATFGYRLEYSGCSMTYALDHEGNYLNRAGETIGNLSDEEYIRFISKSDLLIGDGQYLPNEIELYRNWGHGSVNYLVNQAVAAEVKKLIFSHHDPNRSDRQIDDIVAHYRKILKRKEIDLELLAAKETEEHDITFD